uniref:Uncharacterized protein n=1 Tax=Timema genevievae TaxID=629358 RepID=A0A7R9K310_TIMGE|nr:unnamed protein product [Timema genevievae]
MMLWSQVCACYVQHDLSVRRTTLARVEDNNQVNGTRLKTRDGVQKVAQSKYSSIASFRQNACGRGIRRLEEEFSLQVKTWSIRIMKSVSCKTAMVLVAVMVMVMTVPTRARDEQYTSKYDDMDVDHVMKSDRLMDSYVNCLLDQGPCTPEGKVMKNLLPDALKTDCEKCTEKQRTTSQKVMKHLMKTRPDDWAKLTKKYDPEGLYRSRYSALIVEHMLVCLEKAKLELVQLRREGPEIK